MNFCTSARCACVVLTSLGVCSQFAAAQSISPNHAAASAGGSGESSSAGQVDGVDDHQSARNGEPGTPARTPAKRESSWLDPFLSRINGTGDGWTTRADRIVSGGGLALGQAYTQPIFGRRARVRAETLFSVKGYLQSELGVTSQKLGVAGLTLGGRIRYTQLPQEDFFGVGQGSAASMHSSYSRETTDVSLVTTLAPRRWLQIEATAGFLGHDIDRGRQPGVPSIEERFPERVAPGMEYETEFVQAGVAAVVDLRDVPHAPRPGGWYAASLTHYDGIRGTSPSFGRFEVDVRQFLAVPGTAKHVLALRGQVMSTVGGADAEIPFFMLPRLGGSSLRGYEVSRYMDRHALAFSVEHRWDVHRKLQLIGFVDAGQVSPTLTSFEADRFHTSVGLGVRYRIRGAAALRLDVATGREGARVHVGFGPSF